MQASLRTQVIALSGICLAVKLAQSAARTNQVPSEQLALCLNSVTVLNPASPLDIYGGNLQHLSAGLKLVAELLGDSPQKEMELTRYIIGILALERQLGRKTAKRNELGERLQGLERQLQHFTITDDSMIASLADIYIDCISKLGTRIQIYGQPELLSQSSVQNKVRALLLAAIRSAVLWRQAGGSKLHFIFKRRKLVAEARQALSEITSSDQ